MLGASPCSLSKELLAAKHARGPSGAEVGVLLEKKFSTPLSSCAVRFKEKAGRGAVFHCGARSHHATIVALDLATCVFCHFCISIC